MREYGRVAPTFWTRGSGKKLRGKPLAQVVALYLFTGPSSSMIGIYHLAIPTMAHETGLSFEDAERALAEVCALDIARYDAEEELVYLPEGAKYQIGERLKPNDKRVRGIEAALAQFSKHPFAVDFSRRYAAEFCLSRSPFEAPSKPLPEEPGSPFEAPSRNEEAPSKPGKARQGSGTGTEITHTLRGRAPAHEELGESPGDGLDEADSEDQPPASGQPVPVATDASLLAAVARHPMLRTLHGDRQWALRAAGPLQSAACRAEDAAAAVDAFVADSAAGAPADGPALDDFVRGRGGVGAYLKRAKQYGDDARARAARSRPSEPGPGSAPSPEARVVLETFSAAWEERYERPFVATAGDERRAGELVAGAREAADRLGMRPRDVIRQSAQAYVRDAEPFLSDRDHPFALFVSRINQYPARRAAAKAPPREPVPEEPYTPPPPAFAQSLTSIGSGLLQRPGGVA
jgi:hypothetical protein